MAMNELADRPLRVPGEPLWLHAWRLWRWSANLRVVPRWREHNARLFSRAVQRYFYEGLTRTGKVLFVCSLLTFLFSYRTSSDLLLLTGAVGTALLVWSAGLGFVFRPRVSLERDTPEVATAGTRLQSRVSLHNLSRFGLFNYSVREMVVPHGRWPSEWTRPHQLALAPRQRATMTVEFTPQRRGLLQLNGLAVHSYFPFFLTRFTQRVEAPSSVYVLPPTLPVSIPSLRQVAEQASKRLKLGADSSRKGPSLDYAYSRPYQTGDSLRRLDHRASSRMGQPMSKIFEGAEEIRRDRVHLIVDPSLQNFLSWQRRPIDETPLDERLALAVEVGLSAQNEGFSLTALAIGSQWHELDQPQDFYRHIATCQALKTAAQALPGDPSNLPDDTPDSNGLHIFVLGRWTPEHQALLERWRSAGILWLVFLVPETESDRGSLPAGPQFVEIQSPTGEP